VIQRVKSASVTVDGQLVSSIGRGLLVLAAISRDDTEKDVEAMATKILKTKLWDDDSVDPPGRVSTDARHDFFMLADPG
jgi:D-tyrosyl-tRNA(Tyr) deacylase